MWWIRYRERRIQVSLHGEQLQTSDHCLLVFAIFGHIQAYFLGYQKSKSYPFRVYFTHSVYVSGDRAVTAGDPDANRPHLNIPPTIHYVPILRPLPNLLLVPQPEAGHLPDRGDPGAASRQMPAVLDSAILYQVRPGRDRIQAERAERAAR